MSMNEIRAMREKRVKLWEAAKAFVESRKDVSGTLSAEDSATYDQMEADVIRMGKEIERLERQEALDLEFDRPTARTLTDKPIAPEGKAEKTGRASDAYKAAFWRTMRDKSVPHEVLNALQVGTDSEGGYLVPDEYERTLIESLEEENIFRRFAHIIRTSSGDRKIPIVVSKGTASWIDEEAAYPESDDAFGQTSISAYKLATMIKVSDELLHDSVFDVASYIAREFARRIGAAEEEAFFTGNGTGKPIGLLHTTGGAEVGVTTKSATALTFDEVMDLFYSLRVPYRRNAVFMTNDATMKVLRQLKNGNGDYIWQPSVTAGTPDTILNRPVYTSTFMPTIAAGANEIRLRDTLLRATNATERFSRAQNMANAAWKENTALTNEAGKRYSTTASKLTNLKNKALLFGQQIGDDLNPTIQSLIEGADNLLSKFLQMDEAQRKQIIQYAAIAAAIGPVLLLFGKVTKGIGSISTGIGKFATAVGKAGGGIKGFLSVLGSSPAVWLAVAAATIYATVAIADYVSGAKQAREALKGMQETADKWKSTAAETFYGNSEGLSFFGMSKEDFVKDKQSAQEWLNGLITVWTDGEKESNEIVAHWTDSFKSLTGSTRTELQALKDTADKSGYTSVSQGLAADIQALDQMDTEIERLLKKRQNGFLTEKEKIRLQELIDTREAIEVKYHLTQEDVDGFNTIRQKLEAEVARAQARGKQDADVTVYENALVAAAEGLAAVNQQIDTQYDKEYALIQLIEDSTERQAALDQLNSEYTEKRRAAAMEYAQLLADVVMPVWQQEDIQKAAADVDALTQKLREYSAATETEKPALLEDLNAISAAMDEGAMTEYIAMLTQIQSLLDSGMTEGEIQAMFPEIDFTTALEQIAAIQTFLNNREVELPGLTSMFGEALPEEVLKIATDLDMTGAQERWNTFAENPGAITTDVIVSGYQEDAAAQQLQPKVEAFITKYTEVPEGADKAALTPEGLIGLVSAYAEITNGADVSGLTPENVTAMVSAYKEQAAGVDVSTLKPAEITAYISKYMEDRSVDMSGLSPDGITAFVLAYQEVTGGALTTELTPDNITAMVTKYLEAENVDVSQLSSAQIEAIVSKFAEATGCDKSELLQNFTAYIAKYDDSNAVRPKLSVTVGIYGYDLIAYRKFIAENPVEVQGIVKLGELYENPQDVLLDPKTKYWQDGQEIPAEAVPKELLTADKVAVLDEDGTLHVMVAPDVTGAQESIDKLRTEVAEVDQFGTTALGRAAGLLPTTTLDMIDSALERIETAKGRLGQ